MKPRLGLLAGLLLASLAADQPQDDQIRNGFVGTWQNISLKPPPQFPDLRSIKHITPTHWTWVTYDSKKEIVFAMAGGTWTLEGNRYTEKCEFFSPGNEGLKDLESTFILKYEGEELSIKSAPGTKIDVDETWRRIKRGK
jgi:hypothetical protein